MKGATFAATSTIHPSVLFSHLLKALERALQLNNLTTTTAPYMCIKQVKKRMAEPNLQGYFDVRTNLEDRHHSWLTLLPTDAVPVNAYNSIRFAQEKKHPALLQWDGGFLLHPLEVQDAPFPETYTIVIVYIYRNCVPYSFCLSKKNLLF